MAETLAEPAPAVDVPALLEDASDPEVLAAVRLLVECESPGRVELALRCGRDFVLPLAAARTRVGELETLVATLEAALELVQEQLVVRDVEHREAMARAERAEALASSLAAEMQALRAVAG